MPRQRIHDDELHAHFVTFSCYRRRRLLDHDRPKKIVPGVLNSQLSKQKGKCIGFVVMPDHVHAIVWFPRPGQLSHFMKQLKQRSSVQIKRFVWDHLPALAARIPRSEPIWQRKFYPFKYLPPPQNLWVGSHVESRQLLPSELVTMISSTRFFGADNISTCSSSLFWSSWMRQASIFTRSGRRFQCTRFWIC